MRLTGSSYSSVYQGANVLGPINLGGGSGMLVRRKPNKPIEFQEMPALACPRHDCWSQLHTLLSSLVLCSSNFGILKSTIHQPETMVWIDPEFEAPTIPEDEKYEGTEVDANVLKGCELGPLPLLPFQPISSLS